MGGNIMSNDANEKEFKILLVDDEEDIRECWLELLENPAKQEIYLGAEFSDYEINITSAEDGDDALDYVMNEKIDLVLSDLMMARMGGLELLEKIKEHDPTIPVMIITGRGDEQVAVSLLEKGAFTYIIKGHFRNSSTFLKINSALHLRKQYVRIAELAKDNQSLKDKVLSGKNAPAPSESPAVERSSKSDEPGVVDLMQKIEALNEDLSTSLKIIFHNNKKMDDLAEQADHIQSILNSEGGSEDKVQQLSDIHGRLTNILYSDMMF